jgi:hypothetical protein
VNVAIAAFVCDVVMDLADAGRRGDSKEARYNDALHVDLVDLAD